MCNQFSKENPNFNLGGIQSMVVSLNLNIDPFKQIETYVDVYQKSLFILSIYFYYAWDLNLPLTKMTQIILIFSILYSKFILHSFVLSPLIWQNLEVWQFYLTIFLFRKYFEIYRFIFSSLFLFDIIIIKQSSSYLFWEKISHQLSFVNSQWN